MYTSYFGFKESPFNLTPDPRYLFLSPHHREALDHLLYGINERKGFIAITGGIGTGKTTLCRALLDQLDESIKSALIFNSFITENELLEIINQEFGINMDPTGGTKKEYIDRLNQFLLETFSGGGNAVLLIDEAQNLSHTVLEQIRMLSNLETEKEKLIQIVLVGQSELKELLASSSLRQLNERIIVRYELRPLAHMDVQGYVEHRLVVAGGRGNLRFTNGAFKAIYRYSQGNPRRINAVCDRALLVAYARDEFTISKETVREATEDIWGNLAPETRVWDWFLKRAKLLPVFILLLIILAGFSGWTYRAYILKIFSSNEKASVPAPKSKHKISLPIPKKEARLFLDEQASRTRLFRLFKETMDNDNYAADKTHLGLFSFHTKIENYTMFKKPFQILLAHSGLSQSQHPLPGDTAANLVSSPRYLLIRKVTANGAIAVDAEGKDRHVTKDFLKTHWGGEVSWLYPHENTNVDLVKGMSGPDVLKVQKTLRKIGYPAEITGEYDDSTFKSVIKFQSRLGLKTDGIIGTQTMALLYQADKEGGYYKVQKDDSLFKIAGLRDVYDNPLKWPSLFRLNMNKLSGVKVAEDFPHKALPEGIELRFVTPNEALENVSKLGQKVWVLNVLSTQNSQEIIYPAITLMKNGYPVYITRTKVKGEEWIRLRIGFFKGYSEAAEVRKKIMPMLDVTDAWVAQTEKRELEEYGGY